MACTPCPPCPPCVRYVQPPRPKSFKPTSAYVPPTLPVEACTIYKKSFCPPNCADCKPPMSKLVDNLRPSECKMDTNTTHKMSFQCPPCVQPVRPIVTCNRNPIGDGKLSCVTTQRHDYVPKPITKLLPIIPPTILKCSEKPLEDLTIMQASYQPPCSFEPQKSYKPIAVYQKPECPFQDETVQRLSYVPWPVKNKEHYPWACKGKYVTPSMPMESCTVMNCSYTGTPGERPPAITPPVGSNPISECKNFECCTIYKKSFCPPNCADCKPPMSKLVDNLRPADCKMDTNTTHKMSFQCPPCVQPVRPIVTCNRNPIGEGGLSSITTQRHDYVPKPITKLLPIIPPSILKCSEKPLEDVTVMQASYQPPCPFEPQKSYKPVAVYHKPEQRFQDETVQRLSYVPWPVKNKEHYPWACKGRFQSPTVPLETTSIYKASYFAPGAFMPDDVCMPQSCPPATCSAPSGDICKASCFGECPKCVC